MENLVSIELHRRFFDSASEIFYWKEYGKAEGEEVDFVIKEGLKVKQLIQVTYASSKDEIKENEIKALIKASEELNCKNLLCITWDYEDEIKEKSKMIKFIPLFS
jgi:predicted AAA+ superfamily ATPase